MFNYCKMLWHFVRDLDIQIGAKYVILYHKGASMQQTDIVYRVFKCTKYLFLIQFFYVIYSSVKKYIDKRLTDKIYDSFINRKNMCTRICI